MILVGLKIRIEGFWACKISEEYKNTDFRILDIHPSRDSSRGLIEVIGKQDLEKIRQYLSNMEGITRVENLLDRPDSKLISFYFKHGPLGEIILKTGVHIRPPLELERGKIRVNLIGSSGNVHRFIREAEKLSNASVEIVRKSELKYIGKPQLTKRQERILKIAVESGYYDLPRVITIAGLSKKMELSPSTVLEHLRKAENRIIKDYI